MSFNPKGVGFWAALAGAAICAGLAYGPQIGMFCFLGLAVIILLFG